MILLFTDFGLNGPYIGQMKAVLARQAPAVPVIDLFADAPGFDPKPGAYLLAAYAAEFPAGSIFLCVVDAGVGGDRLPVILEADGRFFVGPGNGLLEIVARRAKNAKLSEITWRPERLSASFHGRDLFAPVAATLARGEQPAARPIERSGNPGAEWPDDLAEIVYIDRYGNAMTGLRASVIPAAAKIEIPGRKLSRQRTFGSSEVGTAFWYENSNGLVEIAVNRGSARESLGLSIGTPAQIRPS